MQFCKLNLSLFSAINSLNKKLLTAKLNLKNRSSKLHLEIFSKFTSISAFYCSMKRCLSLNLKRLFENVEYAKIVLNVRVLVITHRYFQYVSQISKFDF